MINKSDYELLNEIYNTKVPDTKGLPLGVQQGAAIIMVKNEEQPKSKGNLAIKNEQLGLNVMVVSGEDNEVCLVLSSVEGNVIKIKNTAEVINKFLSQLSMAISDLDQMTKSENENKVTSCGGM